MSHENEATNQKYNEFPPSYIMCLVGQADGMNERNCEMQTRKSSDGHGDNILSPLCFHHPQVSLTYFPAALLESPISLLPSSLS